MRTLRGRDDGQDKTFGSRMINRAGPNTGDDIMAVPAIGEDQWVEQVENSAEPVFVMFRTQTCPVCATWGRWWSAWP